MDAKVWLEGHFKSQRSLNGEVSFLVYQDDCSRTAQRFLLEGEAYKRAKELKARDPHIKVNVDKMEKTWTMFVDKKTE